MESSRDRPGVGEQVILLGLPPGFLSDLPDEDRRDMSAMIGRAVTLSDYDDDGRAVLDFVNPFTPDGGSHTTIWVAPEFIERIRR
jgi:hypothetical protein